ncbi:uncharacterized protein LOC115077981 [Rhinatrema bivittatum]|uniref:uncharacterized protein LOC115077981 n=1 Tax=Rhinatrema bivittatum TaxID=194408 RepID=UPI00112D831A|nr:uncharacterized protein LOC115077981 [Rhinatrema bivittatum]
MPMDAGMASNEISGKASKADSTTLASLESEEGAQPDVSLDSLTVGDTKNIREAKDGLHEEMERKDFDRGSPAHMESKENRGEPHMNTETQNITDRALELTEDREIPQIKMMESKENRDNPHMDIESQNITDHALELTEDRDIPQIKMMESKENRDNAHMDTESQNITDHALELTEDRDIPQIKMMESKEDRDDPHINTETQNITDHALELTEDRDIPQIKMMESKENRGNAHMDTESQNITDHSLELTEDRDIPQIKMMESKENRGNAHMDTESQNITDHALELTEDRDIPQIKMMESKENRGNAHMDTESQNITDHALELTEDRDIPQIKMMESKENRGNAHMDTESQNITDHALELMEDRDIPQIKMMESKENRGDPHMDTESQNITDHALELTEHSDIPQIKMTECKNDRNYPHIDIKSQNIIEHALELETSDGLQIQMVGKIFNGGSHALKESKEDRDNLHMDIESQNITDHALALTETSEEPQIKMMESKDDRVKLHMDTESQKIVDELYHVMQIKKTGRVSPDDTETKGICDEQFDDEEIMDTNRTFPLNAQCEETNDSVIREAKGYSDVSCSDSGSRETNDEPHHLMEYIEVCDPTHTETNTITIGDGTHQATEAGCCTGVPQAAMELKETCDIPCEGVESDVSRDRSRPVTEVQDTCNKPSIDRESSVDPGKSPIDLEVTGSGGGSHISIDALNTNSGSYLFSTEESDESPQTVQGKLLDSGLGKIPLLLEGPHQVKELAEKASTPGTQEEGFMSSSNGLEKQLMFNCGLLFIQSDGHMASSASRSQETNRGFHDFDPMPSEELAVQRPASPMGLQTPDSMSQSTEQEKNRSSGKVKRKLLVNTVESDTKSVGTVALETSDTETPIARSTDSNIVENEGDLVEKPQVLMAKDLSASGEASRQSEKDWSPVDCLLLAGMGAVLVGISDGMQMSPSLRTLGEEGLLHGEGEANCLSPHNLQPLLSHDDIRGNPEGAEIIEGDIVLQSGGDVEKDGPESKERDMGLPLELTPLECTNIVLGEAREGKTDDIQGGCSTTAQPITVSSEEGEPEDHLIEMEHEGDVIFSQALASQMLSSADGPLSSLTPETTGQECSPLIQVNTFETHSSASSGNAGGDSKETLPPHVKSVSADLIVAEFPSCTFKVTGDHGDAEAPAVLNNSSCSSIFDQADGRTPVGVGDILVNERQNERKESIGETGGVVTSGGEDTEPISKSTAAGATDMTSSCVDMPSMDTSHLHTNEYPPIFLQFFNPSLYFGYSPEESGQYDSQDVVTVRSLQPNDSESITDEAVGCPQTPLAQQEMNKDFPELTHSGAQDNIPEPIRNIPSDSVARKLTQKLVSLSMRQRATLDVSGESKRVYEEGEGRPLMASPTHQASTHSLPDKRTVAESLSNDKSNEEVSPVVFLRKPKLLQFAPMSTKSKSLFQKVAVSEESKPSFPEAAGERTSPVRKPACAQQPAGATSGRWIVREQVEGVRLRAGSLEQGKPVHPSLKQRHNLGHPPLEKSSSWAGQSRVDLEEEQLGPAIDSKSQENLADGTSKSRDWHRKAVRRPSSAFGILQDEESRAEEDLSSSDPVTLREKNFLDVSSNLVKRRRSRLINSSRLLYQEYSDVVLSQEIQRQKRAETFTEDGEPGSPRMRRKPFSPQDSYLQRLSISSNASLWQDIPMIRGSSALLNMTRDEQKLQEAKFELIMSEASYLRSLNVAVDHFQHCPDLQDLLSNQERQWLFSKLQEVRDVSSNFLFDLEEKFEDDIYTFNVCDVVLNHADEFRKVYLPYVTNQSYQDQTFQQLLTGNARFRQVLERLESDPVCQRLSLKSFLILPFQRITRLKLLVQNILKRTQLGSKEEAEATQAHNALEKLIKDCNENIQRMRSTEELIFLSQKIQFECKICPLISQSRKLVKHGELLNLEYNTSLSFKWKLITRPIYLHLFNDCLLLSRRRDGGRFLVFDHARSSKVRVERCEMKLHSAHKNLFRLFLLEEQSGP